MIPHSATNPHLNPEIPIQANVALWGDSTRIYWDHIRGAPRSELDKSFGAVFAKFVSETPNLQPLVEEDFRVEARAREKLQHPK